MRIVLTDADCRWLACGGTLETADGDTIVVEPDMRGVRPAWANVAAFIDNDGGSREGETKPLGEDLERLVYGKGLTDEERERLADEGIYL